MDIYADSTLAAVVVPENDLPGGQAVNPQDEAVFSQQYSDDDANSYGDMAMMSLDDDIDVDGEVVTDDHSGKLSGPAENNQAVSGTNPEPVGSSDGGSQPVGSSDGGATDQPSNPKDTTGSDVGKGGKAGKAGKSGEAGKGGKTGKAGKAGKSGKSGGDAVLTPPAVDPIVSNEPSETPSDVTSTQPVTPGSVVTNDDVLPTPPVEIFGLPVVEKGTEATL